MRFLSYALPALAANLAAALPRPQDIDLDMVLAAPDPTFTQDPTATAQIVAIDTAAVVAEATAAVSSVSIEISDVLSATAVVSNLKRAAATTCAPQPAGATSAPTYAPGPDTDNASAFLANPYYASVASVAAAPSGYTRSFVAQQGSNNAFGYLGFSTLDDYDVSKCLSRCSAVDGCVSVNIYFERDPSVDPNDAGCPNPASVTMIKCVYWASAVTGDTAVNVGQPRSKFVVAIAGSNGYVSNQIATPDGFQAGVPYGKFAINAPYDAQGYNTFMGSKIFTTTWDVSSCSKYCDAQTAYNKATAPKDGTPYKVCNFFNTYVLTAHKADGSVVPQGQYCALYTEAWDKSYAVNGGQFRGKDQYLVSYSFGYPKSNPGISPTVGDSQGAAYQAVADIKWSSLQPFCSTLLGYSIPVSSVTAVSTTTTVTTVQGRNTVTPTTNLPYIYKRAAQTTPAGLSKYQPSVLSSACSMVVTSPTVTSTTTAATSVTTTVSTATVAAPPVATACVLNPNDAYSEQCADGSSCSMPATCFLQPDVDSCFSGYGIDAGIYYSINHQCELYYDCCGNNGGSQHKLKARDTDTIFTNESVPVIPGAIVKIQPGVSVKLPNLSS
ncbi:hypothetical protein AUEXF2481DRAFT_8237 [Aureobasidium subglaciale EXF-2481]|uniref:Uncharacterized protein n=1 Tax=Aureobasidium subglaciale (strain EXF-2481) TaxID=1043005 RepID=A0A074Y1U5_AURSE|nr:uncharacterized protein AUEXF2481DRAFT_8237 [Aureobasidium subglaciale EXF-2481]KAI5195519.1 hypothetical protein E4T38_09018 [Aureobasidium subglaciale]KAI5214469.1 hypothetical protein E4T40_08993 [Aureobasidium subglaciale]KAI5217222.1 hypothetical protein E4T41_08952 [Aureobasidium subglaciale]KAI5254958.1 hypothetical protein E4T46_08986 [Aureobasidium subglaciale]KEQ91778.1 hypothetical protein AUEXF2481DRAFT_8237 [Aureobasidium subglaciale EXF-2481]